MLAVCKQSDYGRLLVSKINFLKIGVHNILEHDYASGTPSYI